MLLRIARLSTKRSILSKLLHGRMESASLVTQLESPVHGSHRGGGSIFAPENTMYAYRKSVNEVKTQVLEFDVRRSMDGNLVLMHDDAVDRTTNGDGNISLMTLEEIKKLDAAYYFSPNGVDYPLRGREDTKIPTLDELLTEFIPKEDLILFFDLKDETVVEEVIEIIKDRKLEKRTIIGAVMPEINKKVMALKPPEVSATVDVSTMKKIYAAYTFGMLWSYPIQHEILGIVLVNPVTKLLTENLVKAVHKKGKKIAVFGPDLNDVEMQRFCVKIGVDFLFADRPELLRQIITEHEEQKNKAAEEGEQPVVASNNQSNCSIM